MQKKLTVTVRHDEDNSDTTVYEAAEIFLYPPFVVENDTGGVIRIKPIKEERDDER